MNILTPQGRARARDASFIILLDADTYEGFQSRLEVFKGIEQVGTSVSPLEKLLFFVSKQNFIDQQNPQWSSDIKNLGKVMA